MTYNPNDPHAAMLKGYIGEMPPLADLFSVKGKVALVTGGTSGLGFNVTMRLLQGGANVVVASNSQQQADNAMFLFKECGYDDTRVRFAYTDVTEEQTIIEAVRFTAKIFGSLDILVTSAAIWNYAHIYDLPAEEFEKVVATNLTGTFKTVKHVSRYMIENEIEGKITLISSNSAWLPYPVFGGYGHYAASKGGVNALAIEAAKELKRFGIRVNVVAPGGMATPGAMNNMVLDCLSEEAQDALYDEISTPQLDEIKSVDGVARVVYAMCTDLTDCLTGECIVPDNGMTHNIISYQPAISQYPED